MISECTHHQQWRLEITREAKCICDGCRSWPDRLLVNGLQGRYIRPEKIVLTLRTQNDTPVGVTIHGKKLTAAGTVTSSDAFSRYALDIDVPHWAQVLIDQARVTHHCGEGTVGHA